MSQAFQTALELVLDSNEDVVAQTTNAVPAVSPATNITTEVKPQSTSHKIAFEREHDIRILCRSIEKAGYLKTADDLLHRWFPGKSDEFVTRAYAKAKVLGQARIVLKMLAYERRQLRKYGSWVKLPLQLRQAL